MWKWKVRSDTGREKREKDEKIWKLFGTRLMRENNIFIEKLWDLLHCVLSTPCAWARVCGIRKWKFGERKFFGNSTTEDVREIYGREVWFWIVASISSRTNIARSDRSDSSLAWESSSTVVVIFFFDIRNLWFLFAFSALRWIDVVTSISLRRLTWFNLRTFVNKSSWLGRIRMQDGLCTGTGRLKAEKSSLMSAAIAKVFRGSSDVIGIYFFRQFSLNIFHLNDVKRNSFVNDDLSLFFSRKVSFNHVMGACFWFSEKKLFVWFGNHLVTSSCRLSAMPYIWNMCVDFVLWLTQSSIVNELCACDKRSDYFTSW